MITPQVGWCSLLLVSLTSIVMGCSDSDMKEEPIRDEALLRSGAPGYAEVFAQLDPEGNRCYRIVYPPSGRRQPLANHGGRFATVAELVKEIRATRDATVVATDPTAPTSMWLIGDTKVEPLTDAEIAEIRSLLSETP